MIGSVAGAAIGAAVNINTEGVDFSLTALFVTVFVEQWLSTKDHKAAVIGVVSSVACLMIFGAGNFLIPTMIVITCALTWMGRKNGFGHKVGPDDEKGGRS